MKSSLTGLMPVLDEKLKLFKEMLQLSQEQVALLQAEQVDEDAIKRLTEMIASRQDLMNRIDHLSHSINDLKKAAAIEPNSSGSRAGEPGQDEEYISKLNDIRSIINQIQINDSKCQRKAREVLRQMGDKIGSTRQTKKAFQAYTHSNVSNEAWFFDTKK
ncbi:MAG TPA: hypothetical protein DER33_01810 [Syntrophomonas sp.]|jgi:seryl-tRNA synthetase|nr:hypothetical protein [Syntrophomonas sp.]HCF70324.1 hypothetical protein [Syntrophomonas sp.]